MANPLRSLSPQQVRGTLLARLAGTPNTVGVIDRARQIATNLGARPYHVELVWTSWSGEARGEGNEHEIARLELLPMPKVSDLTALSLNPFSAGKLPVGSLRVEEVSAGRYTEDLLRGLVLPCGTRMNEAKQDFWIEVREDGRNVAPGVLVERKRFRLLGGPNLSACCTQYSFVLERSSKDPHRDGQPPGGPTLFGAP